MPLSWTRLVADAALDAITWTPLDVLDQLTELLGAMVATRGVGRDVGVRRQIEHVRKTAFKRAHADKHGFHRSIALANFSTYIYTYKVTILFDLALLCVNLKRGLHGNSRLISRPTQTHSHSLWTVKLFAGLN